MNNCTVCGKYLVNKQKKFCSHTCHNKSREADRGKCRTCGKQLGKKQYKYCSLGCCNGRLWKERSQLLDIGTLPDMPATTQAKMVKRHLLATCNSCAMCGSSEWLGKPILLLLDHIDGNSEDNSLSNVRLICSNCDATLPTYKGRNKGRGRHSRRTRYAEGLSY